MDDRSRVILAGLAGAVLGGMIGYLYWTESGSRVRERIDPLLDDVTSELRRVRGTVDRARDAAAEGRRTFDDIFAGHGSEPSWAEHARQS